MRSLPFPIAIAITLALVTNATAEALRLPANGTPNVPTNAQLWIGDERTLDQATLRDADGTTIPLERIPESTPLRFRPTAELAPQKSYTLTLRFANVAIEETLTFTTGAGAEIHPPPPQTMVMHIRSWQGGGGGPWNCPKGTLYMGELRTSPAPAAVYYRLERSADGTAFTEIQASTTARFDIPSGVAWYRVRPISISNLSPANSELQTLQLTVPASNIPPCYPYSPDDEGSDDGVGCSAAANDTSSLLALGLGLLLIRRRATRPHEKRARPNRPSQRRGPSLLLATVLIMTASASASAAAAFRLPVHRSPNVPTNTHLWISEARSKPLQTATLRDAEGTNVPLERETLQLGSHTLYHLRPDQELKGYAAYTLELQFLDTPLETLSLLTGAGRELTPPSAAQPFAAHLGSQQPGHDGTGCPQVVYSNIYLKGAPSLGAALYLLEHSLTDSQYTTVDASLTPEFTRTKSGWYRIRPVSTTDLSPTGLVPSRHLEVPDPYKPSCSRPEDDEGLACAAGSPSAGGLLALGLLSLLAPRRRRTPAAR